ncbi:MAG: ABC transporter permease, partial [Candidatus Acidiferrales bacterium]
RTVVINTIWHLKQVNPGFDYSHLLTMELQLPEGGKYLERVPGGDMEKTLPSATTFYSRLLEKAQALPGVESAALIGALPTRCCAESYTFSILGHAMPQIEDRPQAGYSEVSAGLFNTLKIPLIKGRSLDKGDTESAPWVIVVNQALVRKYFPNEDPIGQQILLRYDPYPVDQPRPRQIVGVVGDVKHYGLGDETPPFVYASYLQQPAVFPGGATRAHLHENLVLRTAVGGGANFVSAVKQVVADIDPDQPVSNIKSMEAVLGSSLGDWRFYMQLLGIFAAVALGLTRLISSFLYGVKPSDPITYAVVALALAVVAMLACYIPARRATKVDPMVALRYE